MTQDEAQRRRWTFYEAVKKGGSKLEKGIVRSNRYVGGGMRLRVQPYSFMGPGEGTDHFNL
jgi:hypothetical protein